MSLSRLGTQGLSGNTMFCLSPMNLSSWFLNVSKVGAVTICSGNPFHGEITLTERSSFVFLSLSFPVSVREIRISIHTK